nr:hypothetical protein [uncultured bacterium]
MYFSENILIFDLFVETVGFNVPCKLFPSASHFENQIFVTCSCLFSLSTLKN